MIVIYLSAENVIFVDFFVVEADGNDVTSFQESVS